MTKAGLKFFHTQTGDRYWWFKTPGANYMPDAMRLLSRRQMGALLWWYKKTDRKNEGIGECAIPAITFLTGFINGNNISRFVQLGHYTGYSSLFVAATFKRMGGDRRFLSIDIDPWATSYANRLARLAGVSRFVHHVEGDSADVQNVQLAISELGEIQLVFIDTDHTHEHSMKEIAAWWPALKPGGILILHDSSTFATTFGSTPDAGVKATIEENFGNLKLGAININQEIDASGKKFDSTYLDGCGISIIQKPFY
jgi:predicted O-methyltransferase YrrM